MCSWKNGFVWAIKLFGHRQWRNWRAGHTGELPPCPQEKCTKADPHLACISVLVFLWFSVRSCFIAFFGVFSGYLGLSHSHPHPVSPSFQVFSEPWLLGPLSANFPRCLKPLVTPLVTGYVQRTHFGLRFYRFGHAHHSDPPRWANFCTFGRTSLKYQLFRPALLSALFVAEQLHRRNATNTSVSLASVDLANYRSQVVKCM